MKKLLSICLISVTSFCLAFSEPLKQYQTFSWKKVAKAKKYELAIEKQTQDNTYTSELTQQFSDNRAEVLLLPGNYRVTISVFNVLGKKTSTSEWTNFIILDESEPYLYADTFKKSSRWNSPVLNIKEDGVQIVQEEDDEGGITAREGDPTNSFFLKGKNIFFEETAFSLVPKENSKDGAAFESYVTDRPELPLNIFRRDTENGGVVVEYDAENLYSGYYDVVVKNPGNLQTSLELLVLDYQAPQLDTTIHPYDKNYKIHYLSVKQGQTFTFRMMGKGFNSNTVFSFKPDSSLPPYPFASGYDSKEIDLTLESHKSVDEKGTIDLSFDLPGSELHTGYYKFTADNGTAGSASQIFLVKIIPVPTFEPTIEKIKAKKSDNTITYNITGTNIDKDSKITLIAPYSQETDSNPRISVDYVISKKKGKLHIVQCNKENVTPGRYALFVENTQSSATFYFDIDEKYAMTLCNLTQTEQDTLFLRPASLAAAKANQSFIQSKFQFYEIGSGKYKYMPKVLLPAFHVEGSLVSYPGYEDTNNTNLDAKLSVDILNFNWARIAAGASIYNHEAYDINGSKFGGDFFLEIPFGLLAPYAGVGFYRDFTNKTNTIPIQVGFRFGYFLEFSYQVALEQLLPSANYAAVDKYTIGVQLPLRGFGLKDNHKKIRAEIAESTFIDGTEYDLTSKTTQLVLDSPQVSGFSNNKYIQKITLSNNVQKIEKETFANMPELTQVSLQDGLEFIGGKAFANDSKIQTLNIPATVTTIDTRAFDGWIYQQTIILDWTSDDETPRSLTGLNSNCNAFVQYKDGVPYENSRKSTENPNAWYIFESKNEQTITRQAHISPKGILYTSFNLEGWCSTENFIAQPAHYKITNDGNNFLSCAPQCDGIKLYFTPYNAQGTTTIIEVEYLLADGRTEYVSQIVSNTIQPNDYSQKEVVLNSSEKAKIQSIDIVITPEKTSNHENLRYDIQMDPYPNYINPIWNEGQ